MDTVISSITAEIYNYMEKNSHLSDFDSDQVIAERYCNREKYAAELSLLLSTINKLSSVVSDAINNVTIAHQNDNDTMNQLMTKTKPRDYAASVKKGNKVRRNVSLVASSVKYDPKPKIKITQSLGLPAIKTVNLSGVKSDGELYYVESIGQFAFKLCGVVFRGNIGTMFTDNSELHKKIKDCKYSRTCLKGDTCDYYHDPAITFGSTDRRNFIASSFTYIAPEQRHTRRTGKKFGSLEHLDTDIVNVSGEDVQKYLDMCTHDVLCSLLLSLINKK